MPSTSPGWNVAVATRTDDYRDVKNAFFYADHVEWLSFEAYVAPIAQIVDHAEDVEHVPPLKLPTKYKRFKDEIRSAGASDAISQHMTEIESMFDVIVISRHPVDVVSRLERKIAKATAHSHAVVGAFDGLTQPHWSAHQAAQDIMTSMSRLLLPEVSDLSLAALVDLRSNLRDDLDPMRAAMLRLTEKLREAVESDVSDPSKLQAEADNIIATQVEPVVRDADRHLRELLDKKWRRIFRGSMEALGFAVGGWLDPKLVTKAVTQTIKQLAAAAETPEDSTPGAARFVLHARRLLTRKATS